MISVKFSFNVGDLEKHKVDFHFNQWRGNLNIDIDGRRVVDDFRMFSLKLIKVYEFPVGANERHHVRIEKKRKLLLAGLRPQTYRAYIDDTLVKEFVGK